MGYDDESKPAPSPGPGEHLADERELWRRFVRDRDPAIREELVSRNLDFAKRLARRYRGASESFDDLLQVASLALVNAVDRFDPDRGIPFSAFASPTILGELKRHFRDRAWTVRVPRGLHDRMAQVDKAVSRADREAAALALDRRDRRATRAGADRRPRGARGEPQPAAPLARPAGRAARTPTRPARPTGSAKRTRTSSWSRAGSRSTPRSPTSTSASAWCCACASSTT